MLLQLFAVKIKPLHSILFKKKLFDLVASILAGEELTLNSRGESIISYADYAIAMVDEITKGDHMKQRIRVVRK